MNAKTHDDAAIARLIWYEGWLAATIHVLIAFKIHNTKKQLG